MSRVALAGSSGTIGRAVLKALKDQNHLVVQLTRAEFETAEGLRKALEGCDIIISCMASRTGSHDDAWAVDYAANVALMEATASSTTTRFVLLSAICVQKPKLAFQNAKRAFEARLRASELDWTIIHPTAFFKSLSGQFERVKKGKPFLVFGDGTLTACKPISDRDLADFIVQVMSDDQMIGQTLPIGGPGPALTPLGQAELLFDAIGKPTKIKHVRIGLMRFIVRTLEMLARFNQSFQDRAEFARTGLYYATESMLVWDETQKQYSDDMTPSFGQDTLADHYKAMAAGDIKVDLGDHAIF